MACSPPSAGLTFDEPGTSAAGSAGTAATDATGSTGGSNPSGTNPSDPSNPSDPTSPSGTDPSSASGTTSDITAGSGSDESTTGPPAPVTVVEWGFGSIAYAFNDPKTMHHDGFGDEGQVAAAWIETSGGSYVKTLMKFGDVEDFHLIAWRGIAPDFENPIDAMTGPTPPVAASYTWGGMWNLTDTAGAQVADGDYVLQLEFTEENSGDGAPWGPGPLFSIPFTLGNGHFDHMPAGDGLYSNLRAYGHD